MVVVALVSISHGTSLRDPEFLSATISTINKACTPEIKGNSHRPNGTHQGEHSSVTMDWGEAKNKRTSKNAIIPK